MGEMSQIRNTTLNWLKSRYDIQTLGEVFPKKLLEF
jgi:hypothetical protein